MIYKLICVRLCLEILQTSTSDLSRGLRDSSPEVESSPQVEIGEHAIACQSRPIIMWFLFDLII